MTRRPAPDLSAREHAVLRALAADCTLIRQATTRASYRVRSPQGAVWPLPVTSQSLNRLFARGYVRYWHSAGAWVITEAGVLFLAAREGRRAA